MLFIFYFLNFLLLLLYAPTFLLLPLCFYHQWCLNTLYLLPCPYYSIPIALTHYPALIATTLHLLPCASYPMLITQHSLPTFTVLHLLSCAYYPVLHLLKKIFLVSCEFLESKYCVSSLYSLYFSYTRDSTNVLPTE